MHLKSIKITEKNNIENYANWSTKADQGTIKFCVFKRYNDYSPW